MYLLVGEVEHIATSGSKYPSPEEMNQHSHKIRQSLLPLPQRNLNFYQFKSDKSE
jgi:hypothetical protein